MHLLSFEHDKLNQRDKPLIVLKKAPKTWIGFL